MRRLSWPGQCPADTPAVGRICDRASVESHGERSPFILLGFLKKKKKEWKRRPRRAGKRWEGPGGRALAAVSRRSLPPAGSATAVSLPQEVCAGSEAWKMTEDSPSSRKGSDTPVDGERRPRWAQGSCPGPPRPERLCLHMPRPPLSLGLLLRGTPLPGPPAWPHVP